MKAKLNLAIVLLCIASNIKGQSWIQATPASQNGLLTNARAGVGIMLGPGGIQPSGLPTFPLPWAQGPSFLQQPSQPIHFALTVINKLNYDGIMIATHPTQVDGNVVLRLRNTTYDTPTNRGHDWQITSTGVNDGAGAGNFAIYDVEKPVCGAGVTGSGACGLNNQNNAPYFMIKAFNPSSPLTGGYIGINEVNPQNRLQIRTAIPNTSGLRFSDLTSNSPQIPNPGSGVLSLDANGDVIYVPCCSSGSNPLPGPGNYCGSAQNILSADYEMPLNGFNYNFTSDIANRDKVNIGFPCGSQTLGKLNVGTSVPSNLSTNSSYGIHAIVTHGGQQAKNTGIYGEANAWGVPGVIDPDQKGLWGFASGEGNSIGVMGEAGHGADVNSAGYAAYGGYFKSVTSNPATNYGVYAEAANGMVMNGNSANWAGYFQGDVNINGSGWITGIWTNSDQKFKTNIVAMGNVNEKLRSLNGYTYFYKSEEFKEKNFDKTQQIGFIAQELKEVFPQLVKEDSKGYLSVNYQGMIPVLLQAIKEQQNELDQQKAMIQSLLKNSNKVTSVRDEASLVDFNFLDQNNPNPFSTETSISYKIPTTTKSAVLNIYDLTGKQIKSYDISEKGSSSITIKKDELNAGIYIYTLIADQNVIDSKRMIISE